MTDFLPQRWLGAIRRQSDEFDIYSCKQNGAIVLSRIFAESPIRKNTDSFDVAVISVPLSGETVCGDGWAVRQGNDNIEAIVIDGLGHGILAHKAATEAAILGFGIATVSFANAQPQPAPTTKDLTPNREIAKEVESATPLLSEEDAALLKAMPLRKKVGQLLMIGFMGETLDNGLADTMKAVNPGGLIVFGRNISSARQVSDLNFTLFICACRV